NRTIMCGVVPPYCGLRSVSDATRASLMTVTPIALREILDATRAEVAGDLAPGTEFRWIERNSRDVHAGDLFLAVQGERFDGHQFVAEAAAAGAAGALVARRWANDL